MASDIFLKIMTYPRPLLITGARGNLGVELVKVFPDSIGVGRGEFDITDKGEVAAFIEKIKPATAIHAAALTDVIKCERAQDLAWRTNIIGTENLVEALLTYAPEAYFVYISTACVFRGDRGDYGEDSMPNPINFYGLTKLLGEFAAKRMKNNLVIRTNFVPRAPWKHKKVFVDRWGTYLFADEVAWGIKDVIEKKLTGVVHVCGSKKMSMFEVAQMVSPDVKPMKLEEFAKTSGVHLTQDMTLRSIRIHPYKISSHR